MKRERRKSKDLWKKVERRTSGGRESGMEWGGVGERRRRSEGKEKAEDQK